MVKNLPAMLEAQVRALSREDPLEEGMAAHSSILAGRIRWTEEPGGVAGYTVHGIAKRLKRPITLQHRGKGGR